MAHASIITPKRGNNKTIRMSWLPLSSSPGIAITAGSEIRFQIRVKPQRNQRPLLPLQVTSRFAHCCCPSQGLLVLSGWLVAPVLASSVHSIRPIPTPPNTSTKISLKPSMLQRRSRLSTASVGSVGLTQAGTGCWFCSAEDSWAASCCWKSPMLSLPPIMATRSPV